MTKPSKNSAALRVRVTPDGRIYEIEFPREIAAAFGVQGTMLVRTTAQEISASALAVRKIMAILQANLPEPETADEPRLLLG